MIKRLTLAAALVALTLVTAVTTVYAASGLPDEIVVGKDYTLAAGETLQGNLVVYGGSAVLERGSRVTGDVVVIGGKLEASGDIGGDMVLIGGDAKLKETAVVHGDLVTVGGNVSREPGAQVNGQEVTSFGPGWPDGRLFLRRSFFLGGDLVDLGLGSILRSLGWSLTLGVLALLVLVFWPDQTARVGQAIMSAPAAAGGMGLLTAVVGGAVFTVLILALCLGLLGWFVLVAAVLFGWIALGAIVGARLAPALRLTETSAAVTGALGTFLLTLIVEALHLVVCIGPVLSILLASLGLGAVVLTRFGTRPYYGSRAAPAPPAQMPPNSEPPAPAEAA